MSCSICAQIPKSLVANTGREQYLPEVTEALERLDWDTDDDLRKCPECGALYLWRNLGSWTGSGNADEETLERLTTEQHAVITGLVGPPPKPLDEAVRLEGRFFMLPAALFDLVLAQLYKQNRAVARRFIPRMVMELGKRGLHYGLRGVLCGLGDDPSDAKTILAAIDEVTLEPGTLLAQVREHCERTLAS